MFCENCGAQIVDGVKFCSECGKEVKKSNVDSATQSMEEIQSNSSAINATAKADTDTEVKPEQKPAKKSSKKVWIVALIAALGSTGAAILVGLLILFVVIILIIVGIFGFSKLGNDAPRPNQTVSGIMQEDVDVSEDETPKIEIVDAINYEKNVIWDPEYIGLVDGDEKHLIRVPKLVGDSKGITELNQKIYNTYIGDYNALIYDEEGYTIYNIDYTYKVCNGMIAILMDCKYGYQLSEGGFYPEVFYFDYENDKIISFEEYLQAFGLNKSTAESKIMSTDDFRNQVATYDEDYGYEYEIELVKCIIDENETVSIFNHEGYYYGSLMVTTESIVE